MKMEGTNGNMHFRGKRVGDSERDIRTTNLQKPFGAYSMGGWLIRLVSLLLSPILYVETLLASDERP